MSYAGTLLASIVSPPVSTTPISLIIGTYVATVNQTALTQVPMWFPTETSIGIDTVIAGGVKLWYPTKASPTSSVQLDSQWLPVEARLIVDETILENGAGEKSVYSTPYDDRMLILRLSLVPTEKRQRLYAFAIGACGKAMRTFEYEDEGGNVYKCRWILGDALNMPMRYWLKHDVELEMFVESVTAGTSGIVVGGC